MGEFAIELRDVGKSYGSVNVLNGINLLIEPGLFTVFVGPSGCGKSTLLRMIAGLEEISTGDLFIEGTRMNDTHPAKREVAMVFQSYALYPNMTVAENIGFSLRLAGESKARKADRIGTVARQLQLESLLDRKPSELSGGQRQRVAIGRAIIRNPRVFLFDEPLSNLDAALRVHMRLELERLHDELKTTMVYVTHDQVEAMTLADKIVVLNDGGIQQVGTPIELYLRPTNRFVAGFIGSPAMNFLQAELGEGGVVSLMDTHIAHLPVIADSIRGAVTLGIRPEHLKLDYNGDVQFEVIISQQELLGAETLLYTKANDAAELMVRAVGILDAKPGDRITVGADLSDLHLFQSSGGTTNERSILDHRTVH